MSSKSCCDSNYLILAYPSKVSKHFQSPNANLYKSTLANYNTVLCNKKEHFNLVWRKKTNDPIFEGIENNYLPFLDRLIISKKHSHCTKEQTHSIIFLSSSYIHETLFSIILNSSILYSCHNCLHHCKIHCHKFSLPCTLNLNHTAKIPFHCISHQYGNLPTCIPRKAFESYNQHSHFLQHTNFQRIFCFLCNLKN